MTLHLNEIAVAAGANPLADDLALQLESESYLCEDSERRRKEKSFEAWINSQADMFIPKQTAKVDDEEIDRLASSLGF